VEKNKGGVTQRRINMIRNTIGTATHPEILKNIQGRLEIAIEELVLDIYTDLESRIMRILEEVGYNLELLRGSEAKVLKMNGNFLNQLDQVLNDIQRDMDKMKDVTDVVKALAEKDGYA